MIQVVPVVEKTRPWKEVLYNFSSFVVCSDILACCSLFANLVELVNCTGSFSDTYECTVIDASMLIFTDGNETYDELLLPIVKEYMDSGSLNDLHPAIVNVTFKNETQSDPAPSQTSSGIENPGLFAILGVFVAAVIVGVVVWRKKKQNEKGDISGAPDTDHEQAPVSKAAPSSSLVKKHIVTYTHGLQNGDNGSIEQDKTFECDSLEEDAEFEC